MDQNNGTGFGSSVIQVDPQFLERAASLAPHFAAHQQQLYDSNALAGPSTSSLPQTPITSDSDVKKGSKKSKKFKASKVDETGGALSDSQANSDVKLASKKESHAETEKARRATINVGIDRLKSLLPTGKDMPNKAAILNSAALHITELKSREESMIQKWTNEKLVSDHFTVRTQADRDYWKHQTQWAENRVFALMSACQQLGCSMRDQSHPQGWGIILPDGRTIGAEYPQPPRSLAERNPYLPDPPEQQLGAALPPRDDALAEQVKQQALAAAASALQPQSAPPLTPSSSSHQAPSLSNSSALPTSTTAALALSPFDTSSAANSPLASALSEKRTLEAMLAESVPDLDLGKRLKFDTQGRL